MAEDVHKERSRAAYDRYAADYDVAVSGRHARWLHEPVLAAVSRMSVESVLDVGCGTGVLLDRLLQAHPAANAHGIDLSPGMIAVARRKLGDAVDPQVADAEALPLRDASVELVTCVDSFHHYPQPTVALAEMKRVLRPDGRLVIGEWRVTAPFRQMMNALMVHMPDGDVRIYSRDEIVDLVTAAGFGEVTWCKAGRRGQLLTAAPALPGR